MVFGQFVAGLQLNQRKGVGPIAVNFIGGSKNKYCFRTMPSHIFKQIEGAVGVDRKIGKGLFSGPIVRGLGGRMNNKIKIMTLK